MFDRLTPFQSLLIFIFVRNSGRTGSTRLRSYADVMETVFNAWQDLHLTENHNRQLHRDLLRYSEKDERRRGEYKNASNHVVAFDETGNQLGTVFETTSPFDTRGLMEELINWFNDSTENKSLHPLICIGICLLYTSPSPRD